MTDARRQGVLLRVGRQRTGRVESPPVWSRCTQRCQIADGQREGGLMRIALVYDGRVPMRSSDTFRGVVASGSPGGVLHVPPWLAWSGRVAKASKVEILGPAGDIVAGGKV